MPTRTSKAPTSRRPRPAGSPRGSVVGETANGSAGTQRLPVPDAEVPASLMRSRTATFVTRGIRTRSGLTTAGAVVTATIILTIGAAFDVVAGDGPGAGIACAFFLSCVCLALRTRIRHVATALATTPLLYAGALGAVVRISGEAAGTRQLALDVATSLALDAPVLFGCVALGTAIALGRLLEHVVARRLGR